MSFVHLNSTNWHSINAFFDERSGIICNHGDFGMTQPEKTIKYNRNYFILLSRLFAWFLMLSTVKRWETEREEGTQTFVVQCVKWTGRTTGGKNSHQQQLDTGDCYSLIVWSNIYGYAAKERIYGFRPCPFCVVGTRLEYIYFTVIVFLKVL